MFLENPIIKWGFRLSHRGRETIYTDKQIFNMPMSERAWDVTSFFGGEKSIRFCG